MPLIEKVARSIKERKKIHAEREASDQTYWHHIYFDVREYVYPHTTWHTYHRSLDNYKGIHSNVKHIVYGGKNNLTNRLLTRFYVWLQRAEDLRLFLQGRLLSVIIYGTWLHSQDNASINMHTCVHKPVHETWCMCAGMLCSSVVKVSGGFEAATSQAHCSDARALCSICVYVHLCPVGWYPAAVLGGLSVFYAFKVNAGLPLIWRAVVSGVPMSIQILHPILRVPTASTATAQFREVDSSFPCYSPWGLGWLRTLPAHGMYPELWSEAVWVTTNSFENADWRHLGAFCRAPRRACCGGQNFFGRRALHEPARPAYSLHPTYLFWSPYGQ